MTIFFLSVTDGQKLTLKWSHYSLLNKRFSSYRNTPTGGNASRVIPDLPFRLRDLRACGPVLPRGLRQDPRRRSSLRRGLAPARRVRGPSYGRRGLRRGGGRLLAESSRRPYRDDMAAEGIEFSECSKFCIVLVIHVYDFKNDLCFSQSNIRKHHLKIDDESFKIDDESVTLQQQNCEINDEYIFLNTLLYQDDFTRFSCSICICISYMISKLMYVLVSRTFKSII